MEPMGKTSSSAATVLEVPGRRRAQRILLVDDNPNNILLTRELLSSRGYEVASVDSAEAAQQAIQKQPPDLILLDVVLPGKSGYQLCRELKDDPFTRLIPVVSPGQIMPLRWFNLGAIFSGAHWGADE